MNLSSYIEKRNGVPLGHKDSLKNMLTRSLGAGKFSTFWKYWNPIWSYYLGKFIFKPLKKILPAAPSLLLTFIICGFVHDVIIIMVRSKIILLFTPWFFFMGCFVLLTNWLKLDYSNLQWPLRALINLLFILGCLYLAYQVKIEI
ncbi:hypothetical protein NYZ99_17235 [Maribacter litopenaei]|uniref:Acyltransferase n=1 Tax=Maribacter litopenaei TaxID=2976127 RepID=A0ABY5Y6F2_9FLAO|nr:hypothetical protein [Maribacter litopenaei]UWX54598.1 hypothetical protein NYZ99_17235 [Maribacter litopenaei]